MKILSCLALLALPLTASEALLTPAKEMQVAAETLLETLDEGQQQRIGLPMTSAERENFRYTPRQRSGLIYKELNAKQRGALIALLGAAMSREGLLKASQIMALEGVLAELEKRPEFRDPEKYFISIYGTPGDPKGWGWKFEGHHLSLNITVAGNGEVALTPSFFGSNPAEVREGPLKGLRVLAAEEDDARSLAEALLKAGHDELLFSSEPPAEILTGEQRVVSPLKTVGLSGARMNEAQRKQLMQVIEVYLQRHRADLAGLEMAAIREAGVDKIHFGWAGGIRPGEAWYYRIQGPTFLMEAANSQNQANHVHAVWRKFDGDFGRDLLGEHYHGNAHEH